MALDTVRVFHFWMYWPPWPATPSYRRLVAPALASSSIGSAAPLAAHELSFVALKLLIVSGPVLVRSTPLTKTLNFSGILEPPLAVFQMVFVVGAGGVATPPLDGFGAWRIELLAPIG